jgi:hypothetical protein
LKQNSDPAKQCSLQPTATTTRTSNQANNFEAGAFSDLFVLVFSQQQQEKDNAMIIM